MMVVHMCGAGAAVDLNAMWAQLQQTVGREGVVARQLWQPEVAIDDDVDEAGRTPGSIVIKAPAESSGGAAPLECVKRTYQPSALVRKRRHGFLARLRTAGGRRVLLRRRIKGRWKISA